MSTKTLTRAELSAAIYQEIGLSLGESSDLVDRFFGEMIEGLSAQRHVKLSKFGTFSVRSKKQRLGRNPKTGVEAVIAPRNVVSFNPSNILKQRVNKTLAS